MKSSSSYPKATETKTDERQEASHAAESPSEYASLKPVDRSKLEIKENPVKIDQEGYAKVEMHA